MNALTVHIRGDNSQLQKTLSDTRTKLKGLGASMAAAFKPAAITAATAAIAAFGAAAAVAVKGIQKAAEMEDFEASFATLLKSPEKAKARLKELSKFATETPFELPEVVKASKTLQTLTNGALATGKGLRMVGDAAAVAGEPFDELAVHFGRLYAGLRDGSPVGEAMSRLEELGLLTNATRRRLEGMQKAGQKGMPLWKLVTADMAQFAGEMDRRSKTWNGQMSNLQEKISDTFKAFGTPLKDSLKPMLEGLSGAMDKIIPAVAKIGTAIANAINIGVEAFKDGSLGEIVQRSLTIGFKESINFLWGALIGTFKATFQLGQELAKGLVAQFKLISNPSLWMGLGQVLAGVAMKFGGALLGSLDTPMTKLQAGMQWIATKFKNGLTMAVEGPIATLKAGMAYFIQELMAGLRAIPGMSKIIGEGDGQRLSWDETRDQKKREARAQSDPLDNTSITEMEAQIRKNGGPTLFGANAKQLNSTADKTMNSGLGLIAPLLQGELERLKLSMGNVTGQFMSGFKGPKLLDTSGDNSALSAVIARLQEKLAKDREDIRRSALDAPAVKVPKTPGSGEEEDGEGKKKSSGGYSVITSSLARVGGGGLSGGSIAVFNKMENHLRKIVSNTQAKPMYSGPVQGSGRIGDRAPVNFRLSSQ